MTLSPFHRNGPEVLLKATRARGKGPTMPLCKWDTHLECVEAISLETIRLETISLTSREAGKATSGPDPLPQTLCTTAQADDCTTPPSRRKIQHRE